MESKLRERANQETGALATQAAILVPVLFALFLGLVHYTYMYQAGQSLDDSGREAARILMSPDGDQNKARAAIADILDDSVVVTWNLSIVDADTIQVSGTSEQIMPGLPTNLTRTINFTPVLFVNEEDR